MNNNVPKLKFKGFEDEWKEYKLGDFSEKITEKNKGFKVENVISNSAKNGLISQRDFFEKDIANKKNIDGYYIIKNGDFVYNPRKSNEAPYGPINKYKFKDDGVVSPLYFCFRIDNKVNNDYLEEYFKSSKWYKYVYMKSDQGARHDRVSIKDSEVMKMKIKLPSLEEQERIGNFFSILDKLIEEQEGKVRDLELYKKGMMQKIFKQEIRFKDDNGLDYPGWEEKKITEIFNITRGQVIAKTSISPIKIDKSIYPVYSSQTSNYGILGYDSSYDFDGEFLTWTTDGANAGKVFKRNGKFRCTNVCGLLVEKDITKGFANECIKEILEKETPKHVSYVGNPKLMNSVMGDIKIRIPLLEEQRKIANFLSNIDNLKEEEQKNLDDLREMKKGLLQQMFV